MSEQFLQILMYATQCTCMELTLTYVNITGAHQTDQTEPSAVNCPQQTDSTGANIQPVNDPAYCGDRTNQVNELRNLY